jgi:hypothetical protein
MKLIFVYNADSGMLNAVKDISHKLFSPQTYDCFLCSLTHDTFKENSEWKAFRNSSATEMVFLHRDEFEEKYNRKMEYPVILRETDDLETVISKDTLASYSSLSDLIRAVQQLEAAK